MAIGVVCFSLFCSLFLSFSVCLFISLSLTFALSFFLSLSACSSLSLSVFPSRYHSLSSYLLSLSSSFFFMSLFSILISLFSLVFLSFLSLPLFTCFCLSVCLSRLAFLPLSLHSLLDQGLTNIPLLATSSKIFNEHLHYPHQVPLIPVKRQSPPFP